MHNFHVYMYKLHTVAMVAAIKFYLCPVITECAKIDHHPTYYV